MLTVLCGPVISDPLFSAYIGSDFFNYEDGYLNIGATYQTAVAERMEFYISANFGVMTYKSGGTVQADFYYPLDAGLHFLFPVSSNLTGIFGVGVSPQFVVNEETRVYAGPTVKGGFRLRIHPRMEWMAEVQQDLIIGAPSWINTGTRVHTGIVFSFM